MIGSGVCVERVIDERGAYDDTRGTGLKRSAMLTGAQRWGPQKNNNSSDKRAHGWSTKERGDLRGSKKISKGGERNKASWGMFGFFFSMGS